MNYSLIILWHERQRYVPAVLAVTFSAVLASLQLGLLVGTFSAVSVSVDNSAADIWVGPPALSSVDMGGPIPEHWRTRLEAMPEIEKTEEFVQAFWPWTKPNGGVENCVVIGSRLHAGALGAVRQLTSEMRRKLAEPATVVVDQADLGRLGLTKGVGETAQLMGARVRVVGVVHGLKGLAGAYVFCSLSTARKLTFTPPDQVTYLLARCRRAQGGQPQDVSVVVQRLRQRHRDMSIFTREAFSFRSRWHWLSTTGGGIALGCAAVLGLLVGAVVTSQTLYAATAASFREYAVLQALGVPRRRLTSLILTQSFWIGMGGVVLALPAVFALAAASAALGAQVALPSWIWGSASAVTLLMALVSGLTALRSLRLADISTLLR
jgi:putative ABC transport system permease protein